MCRWEDQNQVVYPIDKFAFYPFPPFFQPILIIQNPVKPPLRHQSGNIVTVRISSPPAELDGNLLAIGGKDDSNEPSLAVHKYLPSTDSWEKIANGTLPETKYHAAAISLERGDIIIVAGRRPKPGSVDKSVYIASKPIEQ